MTRRVRRKVRSGNGRLDGRIGLNRPQVPILILGFPAADASIHCRRVHKCEGSSGTQFVELIALNQIVRDLVPIAWWITIIPELGSLLLFHSSTICDLLDRSQRRIELL